MQNEGTLTLLVTRLSNKFLKCFPSQLIAGMSKLTENWQEQSYVYINWIAVKILLIDGNEGSLGVSLKFEFFLKSVFQPLLVRFKFQTKICFTNQLDIHDNELFYFMEIFVRQSFGLLAAILYFLVFKRKVVTTQSGQMVQSWTP